MRAFLKFMKTVFKKFGFFVASLALWAALLAPLHVHAKSDGHLNGVATDCSVCHVQAQIRHVVVDSASISLKPYDVVLGSLETSQEVVFIFSQSFVSSRAPPLA